MSNGISGIRITSADPEIPELRAIEAGVASHDLDHHHALMAFSGGVQLVDGVGGRGDGGVEPERRHGAADIVVDRLGNADDWDALLHQPQGDGQGAVAPDGDHGVDTVRVECGDRIVGAVALDPAAARRRLAELERIPAVGSAQDRAAQVSDAADLARPERHNAVFTQQTAVATPDSDALPATVDGRQHCSPDDGVETWCIAASGRDRDLHVIPGIA